MTETANLSFSYKVKEELSEHFGNARHCQIAELSAIVNICRDCLFWQKFLFKNTNREFFRCEKVLYIITKYF